MKFIDVIHYFKEEGTGGLCKDQNSNRKVNSNKTNTDIESNNESFGWHEISNDSLQSVQETAFDTFVNTDGTNNPGLDKDRIKKSDLPKQFTYPFFYTPHPLVVRAADDVKSYILTRTEWHEELSHGKMFGVLLIETPEHEIGYLAGFSGNLAGSNNHAFFVPPVFDLLRPGDFFKVEEANISEINQRIQGIITSTTFTSLKDGITEARSTAERELAEARAKMKEAKKGRDAQRDILNNKLSYLTKLEDIESIHLSNTLDREQSDSNNIAKEISSDKKHRTELQAAIESRNEDAIPGSDNNEYAQSESPTDSSEKIILEEDPTRKYYQQQIQELIRESQFQKAEFKRLEKRLKENIAQKEAEFKVLKDEVLRLKQERKRRSAALQQKLFEHFCLLNARGEIKDLCLIFQEVRHSIPPAGAGECALPKMLQYAYLHQLKPLAFGEFWWGQSPKDEIRHHGQFYPSCKGKCEPILQHMLVGLDVEENPLSKEIRGEKTLNILYEDESIMAISKPAGMLSTPGKEITDSVLERLQTMYPEATGPLLVHRLDMATSGILLAAKTKEVHAQLQALFEARKVRKVYTAILEGIPMESKGCINLPLCLNPMDRPRQMVSYESGKEAVTFYKVIATKQQQSLVEFDLQTGRTHQIRVHAAHPDGLNCPIKGDNLYGRSADRLYLHATEVEFIHPISGKKVKIHADVPFKL